MSEQGVAIGVAVASSTSVGSDLARGGAGQNSQGNLSSSYDITTRSGGYVGAVKLEHVRESLGERDWAITWDVARLRLISGRQLERLHFADLAEASRGVVRRRVLGRLVKARVLATLERRIGGVRAGSSGLVYALDIAGKRLLSGGGRASRPGLPGERYVRHVLAVGQLYVDLVELSRAGRLILDQFDAETASWWPDGHGGRLKPDAHVLVASGDYSDHWWIEVDLATEHGPVLKRKLVTYFDFYHQGELGPGEVMPWVLVSVPDAKRYSEIDRLIHQLPLQARELFTVVLHNDAAGAIMRKLYQS
jgi:hypothetical protein